MDKETEEVFLKAVRVMDKHVDRTIELSTALDREVKVVSRIVALVESLQKTVFLISSLLFAVIITIFIIVFYKEINSVSEFIFKLAANTWNSLGVNWQTTLFSTLVGIFLFFVGRFSNKPKEEAETPK